MIDVSSLYVNRTRMNLLHVVREMDNRIATLVAGVYKMAVFIDDESYPKDSKYKLFVLIDANLMVTIKKNKTVISATRQSTIISRMENVARKFPDTVEWYPVNPGEGLYMIVIDISAYKHVYDKFMEGKYSEMYGEERSKEIKKVATFGTAVVPDIDTYNERIRSYFGSVGRQDRLYNDKEADLPPNIMRETEIFENPIVKK